jgi:ring-1,2-phenylacetyl-CoA epoxidase subunit PaaC
MNAHATYLLHLADNALILGQRNAQWCGHGPQLEEDIALTNISLDLVGQARLLYQHAADRIGNTNEDQLAYWREAHEFRNHTLLELPHTTAYLPSASVLRDYSVTTTRNFLYSSFMNLLWAALQNSTDAQLAAIAAKSLKEVRYHLRHSTGWMLRLGDGTPESHARMQAALDHLMPYTQEFWTGSDFENAVCQSNIGADVAALQNAWHASVAEVVTQASLQMPPATGYITQGKNGLHSEHLSYLLADMQCIARAHPNATW